MRRIHSLLIAALLVSIVGVFQIPDPVKAHTSSSALSFTPTSLSFGNVVVGVSSAAKTVIIENVSTADVNLGKLSVTGEFRLTAKDCNWKNLAPNDTCTFSIAFSPLTAVYKTGTVTIPSDASPSPDSVPLNGYGITGTNLLKSPGFDFPFSNPIPWRGRPNSMSILKILDCSVSLSPLCSVRLSGSSRNYAYSIYQSVPRVGLIGDKILFRLSSQARNIPAGGQYKVEVQLMNMYNKIIGSKSINFTKGTHDFETVTGVLTARAQYTWVVFRFTLQKTGGSAWFDNAQVIITP